MTEAGSEEGSATGQAATGDGPDEVSAGRDAPGEGSSEGDSERGAEDAASGETAGAPSVGAGIAIFVAAFAASTVVGIAGRSAGLSTDWAAYVVASGAFFVVMGGLVLVMLGRGAVSAGALRLDRPRWLRWVIPGFLGGLLAQLLTVVAYGLVANWFPSVRDSLSGQYGDAIKGASGSLKVGIAVVVVGIAPVAEELFFRGALLAAMERNFSRATAVVATSALFALAHFNLVALPALFLLGVAFAVGDIRAKSLAPSVMAHIAVNATAVVGLVAGGS